MTHSAAATANGELLAVALRPESAVGSVPALPADSLSTVWRASCGELARLAVTMGLSPADADDVLQDV
jgi:hypothetical protein